MILDILVGFLLVDVVLALLFWILTYGEFQKVDTRMTKAEKARDHNLDEWFRSKGNVSG